jgi:hypothetical protein
MAEGAAVAVDAAPGADGAHETTASAAARNPTAVLRMPAR